MVSWVFRVIGVVSGGTIGFVLGTRAGKMYAKDSAHTYIVVPASLLGATIGTSLSLVYATGCDTR